MFVSRNTSLSASKRASRFTSLVQQKVEVPLSLLSKTTIDYIITTIQRLMKSAIAAEVRKSGKYSVQIDTTQDITAQDQCSVVIRYVTDTVHERLVAVTRCEASTGQYFAQLVNGVLVAMDLDVKQCIGNSTDGASNMQGQYKGFSALLSEKCPTQIHVWCYSHILNLVLTDQRWKLTFLPTSHCGR